MLSWRSSRHRFSSAASRSNGVCADVELPTGESRSNARTATTSERGLQSAR